MADVRVSLEAYVLIHDAVLFQANEERTVVDVQDDLAYAAGFVPRTALNRNGLARDTIQLNLFARVVRWSAARIRLDGYMKERLHRYLRSWGYQRP
jgi:hypothetical protein